MRLAIAADHGGFALKKSLVGFLKGKKIEVIDLGTSDEVSVDYPDFAVEVARRISTGEVEAGILACGTGIGVSITANKFRNVRAAVVNDDYTARMAKEHNNANILCLGGRTRTVEEAKRLITIWLETPFGGERHQRRLDKITEIESKNLR